VADTATDVYGKFNYDRLRIDKALGDFPKSYNKKKKKKNDVCSAWETFPGPRITVI